MSWGSDSYLMPPFTLPDSLLLDTDTARQGRYQAYLDFYNGAQWQEPRKPGERRLTVNYARTLVHKGASYLFGKPVRFELVPNGMGQQAEQEAQQAEQFLTALWHDNDLAQLDYDTALDASILGDAAFKVTMQKDEVNSDLFHPSSLLPHPSSVTVRAVDVMGLSAGWRGDDVRKLLWVCEDYRLSGAELAELVGPGATLDYGGESRHVVRERWSEQLFSIEVDGVVVREGPNPYGFIPYVIFPNLARPRQFWGLSDLEDLMPLNSEFNVRVSILSQLLQMSGNPVLVLQGVDSANGLRVGPGAVWTLPDNAQASLLELIKDGGVDLHIKYIELLYRMMHDLAELPGAGFGRDGAGQVSSGVALEQLLHPVVQRVNRKRRLWETALDRRNRLMLRLAGLPDFRSRFIWPDILPRDRAALVTQEVGLVASNIHSLDTARRTLGDEQPDLENDLIRAEWEALGQGASVPGKGHTSQPPGIRPAIHLSGALVQGLSGSGG